MLLHKASLDGVISFGDIEDYSNLITFKLEEIFLDVSQRIRTFNSKVIEICGSIPEGAV